MQHPTSILTRAEIAPPFGSQQTRDVSALPTPFPRGVRSPPLDSWRRHPVLSSRVARSLHCARCLPVRFTTSPPLLVVIQVNASAATWDSRESREQGHAAASVFSARSEPPPPSCPSTDLRQKPSPLAPPTGDPSPAEPTTRRSACTSLP
jgi:hypothetical protein